MKPLDDELATAFKHWELTDREHRILEEAKKIFLKWHQDNLDIIAECV